MKRHLLKLVAFVSVVVLSLTSCVDDTYDLSDGVDTDNLVVGSGGFVVPLGDIEIDISKFIENLPLSTLEAKAPKEYTFAPYSENLEIGAGFDDGIIDMLTEYGDITMKATVKNIGIFPFNLNIKAEFAESKDQNGIIVISDENVTTSTGSVDLVTRPLNKEILTKIANSKVLKLSIAPADGGVKKFSYDIEKVESVKIHLSIKKTGGIKL